MSLGKVPAGVPPARKIFDTALIFDGFLILKYVYIHEI